jgi:DNA-directed RNA polymerase specialized sigma24 family protein
MRQGTSRDPSKDAVLLPIINAHAQDHDPRWRRIFMVIFWPGLEGIWRRKRYWDSDPDALWTNVTWAFLRTVCRLDPSQRSSRLVQWIVNGVFHALHDDYRREWDRTAREAATDPEELAGRNVEDEREAAAAALWVEQESRIAILKAHRAAGRINDADFLLLVGTHVYGQSLADYAEQAGLTYEAAKKRQQRAKKAIGGFPSNDS